MRPLNNLKEGNFVGKKGISEDNLKMYGVIYLGGHPSYPDKKHGEISFSVMNDCFNLQPTFGTKKWFVGLIIPYNNISKLEIVERTVSTAEGILGGINSRQLNQANNIHITYTDENGKEVLLRLEMLSGISVMGQAIKCKELIDFLKINGILDKFRVLSEEKILTNDIPTQIKKLAELKDMGILTENEFNSKKSELLAKI